MRRKGRQHLAADLAFRVSLGVDVDVPFTRRKLPGLIWGQGRLPVDRTFHGTPLFGQPDQSGSILARLGGTVELSHGGWTRQAAVGNRPGQDPRAGVVRQVGDTSAGGRRGWYLLAARKRHLERYGRACTNPGQATQVLRAVAVAMLAETAHHSCLPPTRMQSALQSAIVSNSRANSGRWSR